MWLNKLWTIFNQQAFSASAMLLIFGFLFSRLTKLIKLPRVTGYILAGILLGPSLLKVFQEPAISQLDFIPQFALGTIAMIIGAGLSLSLIRRLGFALIAITLFESLGAFTLVLGLLCLFKMPLEAAFPLAAIAAATAPAATVAIIQEYRARGPLTETTLAVVALDDAIAITLFGLILTLDFKHLSGFGSAAIHSLSESSFEIMMAMVIGLSLALLAHLLIKLTKETSDALIVMVGIIFLGITLAAVINVSPLLTNMFLGMMLINISSRNNDIVLNLERLTPPVYCFFFVLAGANLDLSVFAESGKSLILWGVIFILARLFGKISGAYIGATLSKSPDNIRKYLGFALAPQAGVAIGLSLLIGKASGYFEFKAIILNITLMTVAVNEIIGPILTKYALFKAKEAETES